MKWQIVVNGRPVEIDPGQLDAVEQVEPGVYSLLLDGKSFEARVTNGPNGMSVEVDGRRFAVEVRDPRDASRTSKAAPGRGRQDVTAPMPGKVIRVLVKEGEQVEAGQGLVVVEAMKMQNEMKAARPGKAVQVRARDGDTVGAGDVLVVLE